MKKFKLVACAAAAAATFASGAFAQANMDSTTEITNAGVYVNETTINPAGTTLTRGPNANQNATVSLGASFAADAVAYVRLDLPAGVKFVGAPNYTVNDDGAGNLATPQAALVSIAQGGAGESFVIFAVAPRSTGSSLVGANVGTMVTGTGVSVVNNSAVGLTYKLFETLTNAANNTLPLKTATEASFVSFANAISITAGATQTAVADVAAGTGAYTKFLTASVEEAVAAVTVGYTARALVSTGANPVGGVGDILADSNDLTVTGDFTASGAVTLGPSCAAVPVATATIATDKLSATFTDISAANLTAAPLVVCYAVNATSQIVTSTYSGALDLDGETGFTIADGATGTGSITRNGTVLKAAFGEVPAGSFSGTVNLSNTGANVANFTTSCITTTGRVAGRDGSVAANSASRFGIASAAGLACPASTRGLELTFAVPTGNVIGSVVRQDATTGQAAFDGMVGNE